MKAKDMEYGRLYDDDGRVVNLHFVGDRYAIVSAPGDLDMQSQWGLPLEHEVTPVDRISTDGKCPHCGRAIEPTNNPDNPEVCKWSHWCTDLEKCGWMGNVT